MFTWIPIYEEIASKILEFQDRQGELLSLLGKLRAEGLKVIQLTDRDAAGNIVALAEIDPLTFFASFNRTSSTPGRQAILQRIKDAWHLNASVPEDFEGVPLANAQNSWAIAYAANREPMDVPILWRAAHQAVEKDWRTFDKNLFNEALGIRQMGLARMSMSLFWMKPKAYLSFDKNTRAYFERQGIICESETASGYFSWMDKVVAKAGNNFPQISLDAYREFGGENKDVTEEDVFENAQLKDGPGDSPSPRYWILSAGEGGGMWGEFHENNIAAIGWDDLGDLIRFKNKEEIRLRMKKLWPSDSSKKNDALACWQFAHDIQKGDIIFAKQGKSKVFGVGVVLGPYFFNDEREEFKHVHKTDWRLKGEWELPYDSQMALKTLTDISGWPELVKKLVRLTGFDLDETYSTPHEQPKSSGVAYWWLNANPKIWDFRNAALGSHQTYTSHNDDGRKRRIYEHFQAVKPGDLVIGYVTSPDKEVVGLCEITKALHTGEDGEVIEFKKAEQFTTPITWAELQAVPELVQCEPLQNNQGSLFSLTETEYKRIRELTDANESEAAVAIKRFTKADALDGLFMPEMQFDSILALVTRKKALILQGPPGVGKTFVAQRIAYALMGQKDERRVSMVQFHPSYGYEDFIQGYRPDPSGGLKRRNGVFYEFARLARNDPGRDWFFIIDEINRGNLAKIFGELLMLLEADKRGPEYQVALTYSEDGEKFYLPENLHVIGTMNTADRSLAMVDYALRRRFAFKELEPALDSTSFANWFLKKGASKTLLDRLRSAVATLNAAIEKERDLGPRFRIGHSFFCPALGVKPDEAWYREIILTEIKPLLEEYFDSAERVENLANEILK